MNGGGRVHRRGALEREAERRRCSRLSEETERREWGGCAACKEGERSSLRALCSVELLDVEWAGEAVRRGVGGTPSSEDAPRVGGEATAATIGEGARAE